MVKLHTNFGVVSIDLDAGKAPETVANFLQYVEDKHFDNTIFHRVIDGFMIQGGGFEPGMRQKATREPVKNEADNGLKNAMYTIAMARTSNPNSATAQFFINVNDNTPLNWGDARGDGNGYAVFGKVVAGLEVVGTIANLPTGAAGPFQRDVPRDPVIIEKMTVVPAKK